MRETTTQSGRLRRFAPVLALAAALPLAGCPLLDELSRPKLDAIEPEAGPPGTQVELQGATLRNPFIDDTATVWFGEIPIRVRDACEVAQTPNPDLSRGCITLWNNDTIRFITPTDDILAGERIVRVETDGGFSNPLTFAVERGDGDGGNQFDDFVGAVVLDGDEKIALFRMHKDNDSDPDRPSLELTDWDASGRRVTSVTYKRPGFDSIAWDLQLDDAGNLFYALTALPEEGGDGVHQLVQLGGDYTVPVTSFEVGFDPVRLAVSRQWVGTDRNRLAVLSYGGGAVQVFDGSDYEPRAPYYLGGLGAGARPEAGYVFGDSQIYVAGRTPGDDTAWLANIRFDNDQLTVIDDVELGDVMPVDVARVRVSNFVAAATDTTDVTSATVDDVFVAFNDGDTGGLLRRRQSSVSESTDVEISRLTFPEGYRINAMSVDEHTTLGGTAVPRLWLSIDDVDAERNDDFVLGLRVTGDYFPSEDSTYTEWAAAVSSATATSAATDGTSVSVVAAFTELRRDCADCPRMVDGPFGVSVLPSDEGATFVLVANNGDDSLLVVRTDVTETTGLFYDEYNLPGTLPTRVSCYLSEGS